MPDRINCYASPSSGVYIRLSEGNEIPAAKNSLFSLYVECSGRLSDFFEADARKQKWLAPYPSVRSFVRSFSRSFSIFRVSIGERVAHGLATSRRARRHIGGRVGPRETSERGAYRARRVDPKRFKRTPTRIAKHRYFRHGCPHLDSHFQPPT